MKNGLLTGTLSLKRRCVVDLRKIESLSNRSPTHAQTNDPGANFRVADPELIAVLTS